jgi:hypothetical protein
MDLQASIDRSPAPKRARRESLEPLCVTTRRQVAKALNRAQFPSSPAKNLVLMTLPVDLLVLARDPPSSAYTIRPSLICHTPAAFAADQNRNTNMDTAPMALAAQRRGSISCHLDSYLPSLCIPEPAVHPVAASTSHTAPALLLAVANAAGAADAPVEANSVSLSKSLLHGLVGDALWTGFTVDDKIPLPWLEELARSTSRHEHTLPLTNPTAGASNDQVYEDDQTDMSFSERALFNSEGDWFYQPNTLADNATTSALADTPEELNEVMDTTLYAPWGDGIGAAIDSAMDTSWVVFAAAGYFSRVRSQPRISKNRSDRTGN